MHWTNLSIDKVMQSFGSNIPMLNCIFDIESMHYKTTMLKAVHRSGF